MSRYRTTVLISALGMLVWIGLAKGWPLAASYLGLATGLSVAAIFLAFAVEFIRDND